MAEKQDKYEKNIDEELAKQTDKGMKPEKEVSDEVKKEFEKVREKLESFKKVILKKFPFITSLGLLPPQASKIVEEEEEIADEMKKERLLHLFILVPDEKAKELAKIKAEAIKLVSEIKPKVWIHAKTSSDLWEICFDGKYDYVEAISMSFPLADKGLLGALRVANIHKSLVLRKFERYVVSYVIAGSMVRGTATKTSDVDIYVVIDDTDVKRMNRFELKEKLRAIIYQYVYEASEIAGVKNKLSPQIYILTEFWEAVKDAHPVIFTFIRDGVPFYDRGAFMPWKLLLKMGKIKPSPEAIDMFMSLGDRVNEDVKKKLTDLVTNDIYWGIITPSQAILMLYGVSPPTPRETVKLMKEIFVDKEKMLEQKYIDILDTIVEIYKGYEHEKVKSISGKEIDKMLEEFSDYIKRLKELMTQIESSMRDKTIIQIYQDVFSLLERIFGKGTEEALLKKLENEVIKKGKLPERALVIAKEIAKVKKDYKKKKPNKHEVESARRDAFELMNWLIEYAQRYEIADMEKAKLRVKYKKEGKEHEVDSFVMDGEVYVMLHDVIKKVTEHGVHEASREEFQKAFEQKKKGTLNEKLIKQLEKLLPGFEIVL